MCGFRFRRLLFVLSACFLCLGTNNRLAIGVTLADLFNGGSITVGNCRFGDWELISVDSTASTLPNFALIPVVPLIDPLNPGVQIQGNNQLGFSTFNAIELQYRFRVSALAGGNSFAGHSLGLTGVAFGGATGTVVISQEVSAPSGTDLQPTVVFSDIETGFPQTADSESFAHQSGVTVNVDVFLTGFHPVNLTSFTHRFLQTGPAILPGDYNDDGVVNAGDYVVWRDRVSAPAGSLPNDINGGAIGPSHYNTWKSRFGATSGAGASAAVPEPTGWVFALLAGGWGLWRRSR